MDAQGGNKTSGTSEFVFLRVAPNSGTQRKHNARTARARAVKTNRANYLASRTRKLSKDAKGDESEKAEQRVRPNIAKKRRPAAQPLPLCKVQPQCRALDMVAFDWKVDPVSAKSADYLLKIMWPVMAGREATAAWFQEFCTDPLIFHVSHVAAAAHRDILAEDLLWSSDKKVLSHKAAAICRLQSYLSRPSTLTPVEAERSIFGILTLSRHEFWKYQQDEDEARSWLFDAHFPTTNWIHVYGRPKYDHAYLLAVKELVEICGGLSSLQLSGLAFTLARADLTEAAARSEPPLFPSIWDDEAEPPLPPIKFLSTFVGNQGSGFLRLSDVLRPEMVRTYYDLAILDRTMGRFRLAGSDANVIRSLLNVRNAKVYRLLTLPRASNLDNGRNSTYRNLQEICRLACILYTNAVMVALPPQNGWHKLLVSRLRFWLNSAISPKLPAEIDNAILWCLCVGAMAAYSTADWSHFRRLICEYVERRKYKSWSDIQEVLRSFLWSDSACGRGMILLREVLESR